MRSKRALHPREDSTADPGALSARERECLLWSALGKQTKQIARVLDIAPDTVNEHVASAMKKLKANSRSHAVSILLRSER
jgi:LuxR family transcriptional regulator, quorum-sensing system regulator BjaR1